MASFTAGTKTVSSAGTRVQVTTTPTPVRRVRFHAPPGNSGITYVGGSDVASSVAGIEFSAAGGGIASLDDMDREAFLLGGVAKG